MKKKVSKQSSRQNISFSSSSKPSFDKHKLWMGIGIGLAVILVLVIVYVASSGKTLAGQATAARCSTAGQVCTSTTQSNTLTRLVCDTKIGRCVNNECPAAMNALLQSKSSLSCVSPSPDLPSACVASGNVCVERVCFARTPLTKVVEKCNGYTNYCTFKKGLTGSVCDANEGLCVKSTDCVSDTSCGSTKMCVSASACTPTAEVCDQRDNDCDGKVDEDVCLKENLPCTSTGLCDSGLTCKSTDDYLLDPTVRDDKLCCSANKCNDGPGGNECVVEGTMNDLGNRVCKSGSWERICAQSDICSNGLDDDCDGQVDEIGDIDICDGFDNNCDGRADEGACGANKVCMENFQCADSFISRVDGTEYEYNGYCHTSDESDSKLCCPEDWCNDGSAEGKCVAPNVNNDDNTKVCRVVDGVGVWRFAGPLVGLNGVCQLYSADAGDSNCAPDLFCKSVPPEDTDSEPNTMKCCRATQCNAHEVGVQAQCVDEGTALTTPDYKWYLCQAGEWASKPQAENNECRTQSDCGAGLTCKSPAPDSNGKKLCCPTNNQCNSDNSVDGADSCAAPSYVGGYTCREGQWQLKTGNVNTGGFCTTDTDCLQSLSCLESVPGSNAQKRCCNPIDPNYSCPSANPTGVDSSRCIPQNAVNQFPAQPSPLYGQYYCEAGSWKARESWTCTQDSDCRAGLSCKDTIPGTTGQKRCCSATMCNKDPQTPSCTADGTQDASAQYQCTAGSWQSIAPTAGSGDVNGDNSVSDADVLALQYAILAQGNSNCGEASQQTCAYGDTFACDDGVYDFESFTCEGTLPTSADVNGDGTVTDADVLALQYAILAQGNSNCGAVSQQTCSYGDTFACDDGVYDFESFMC